MKLRTEIKPWHTANPIKMDDRLVSLGSCFSRAIGSRLYDGGLNIDVTPLGILFNPVSIAHIISRGLEAREFSKNDLYCDMQNTWHALALESRRQGPAPSDLLKELNNDFADFSCRLRAAHHWLVTFGTAWCFTHIPTASIVGNCHKLPDKDFTRHLCSINDIVLQWSEILRHAPHVIFTVSPVRHLNDGLHGNTLSKSILHLAIDSLCQQFDNAEYFPAFEALNDDLRDYRFYADDMKHPSTLAEEYIFSLFKDSYFHPSDRQTISVNRKKALMLHHRPII